MTTRQEAIEHGRCNYRAFYGQIVATLLPEHRGEWAVLRHERVTGLYATREDALAGGTEEHTDGLFSIQEVQEEQVIDLGWYSHVL